jgi:O-acetyl-ADP-ribose deacetylase (regulator of RNase III)
LQLHFVDSDLDVVEALRCAFLAAPEIEVCAGDILTVASNTVVSPANSQGYMDGGIDRAYLGFFGAEIQVRVQEAIARRLAGYLPVGSSLVVSTGHPRIPYLLLAPTMCGPEYVPAEHSYRAMRAVLRIASSNGQVGEAVYCPGLGTGVGGIDPGIAAKQMARAYLQWRRA